MATAAHQIAAAPAAQPALPDELLEDIFLRLDAAADLARASAACNTFHRVVSARRFLRRFCSLHPPPVLGFLESHQPGPFDPADPPHRSAPAARALDRAADFSFSFLPNPTPNSWNVCDARDSRVLLYRRASETGAFADLVVCDPLHRRYVQLPPIPDDLAVSTGARGMPDFDPFFDPASKEEKHEDGEEDLSFGVICAVQCQHKLVTFNFSSVTGKWRALMFDRVLSLATDNMALYIGCFERHYAHGCFYWTIYGSSGMLMQDTREMRLARVEIPTVTYRQQKAIVEAGEGRLGLLALGDCMFHLYCKTLRNICIGTEKWHHDRTIPLPKLDSHWRIIGAAKGCVLLQASQFTSSSQEMEATQYFTLDLKTFLVERLSLSNQPIEINNRAHLYASFPPPLSLPCI
ncbi:hypothetical protein SEVIR_3G401800v4 [Setaria viridis]|uniref:F-box domain-containing protein n=1 Tax=Setaria viridis TaxID=4556 RepID=A0A4U6VMK3_SETVI|nr:uncharacterized protein LOC117847966 [Setaria viridis]XP_034585162.1 uncharacterized protein LOC117847966 [Setaria viridis]XP_034585164.1 uncharacterized protein LOC117847966 [Setaria viridis]TKW29533.1 hypothetical protein SEVIR_3G401800v2 [Setaria viridis]